MRVKVKLGYEGYYGHQIRREGDVFDIRDHKRTRAEAEEHAKDVLEIRPKENKAKIIKALTSMPQEFSNNWMDEVPKDTPIGIAPRRANAPDEMKLWGPKGRSPEFHADIEDPKAMGSGVLSADDLKEQAAKLLRMAKEAEEAEAEEKAESDAEQRERDDLLAEAEADEKKNKKNGSKKDDDEGEDVL